VQVHLNLKGDPLRLQYASTRTDNNNVYGENVGKKVTEKRSWMKSHRNKSHKKKVTGKKSQEKCHIYKVIFQIIKGFCKKYFNALILNLFIL
jgi:hypothetical protein